MSGVAFDPTQLTAADFAAAAATLPPPGDCFPRDPSALLQWVVGGISDTTADTHALAVDLLAIESDPSQTVQLLPDFERVYGLPNPCTPPNPTIAQRRAALLAKMAAQGGQNAAYFETVAAALGVEIAVARVLPSWAGQTVAGDPLYGPQAVGEWAITLVQGDPASVAQLQCTLGMIDPGQSAIYWQQ